MRVEVQAGSPESVESDVLAAPLVAEEGLSGPLAALNGTLGGLLARLAEQGEITGKLKTAPFVHVEGELKAARLALPGIGAREAVDADAPRTAAGTLAHDARGYARPSAWPHDHSAPPAPALDAPGLDEIRALGLGACAAVAQGSHNPARLIVVRYEPPEPRGDAVLGLVGKAVTFDTGGISIKKPAYMEDMKGDMAGGGA